VLRRGIIDSPEALGRMLAQGHLLAGMGQRDLAGEIGVGQKWMWDDLDGGRVRGRAILVP